MLIQHREIAATLAERNVDRSLSDRFLSIWPSIASILEAFSRSTDLPIFVFFGRAKIFQSSAHTMPPFCKVMLGTSETEALCIADGARRVSGDEPDISPGVQLCHAGMLNGRCVLKTSVGEISILYGSRKPNLYPEAQFRQNRVIDKFRSRERDLGDRLFTASVETRSGPPIKDEEVALMQAIGSLVENLLTASITFHQLAVIMAHELTISILGLGLMVKDLELRLGADQLILKPISSGEAEGLGPAIKYIMSSCQLSLYIVRNFLSFTSESRYADVIRPEFARIEMTPIVAEMLQMHESIAAKRGITFDTTELTPLPSVFGHGMEIRRAVHNVLSNAIKYSYHSTPQARRVIRVRSKVPYERSFKRTRFSLSIENFGVGFSESEKRRVGHAGFRGSQAVAQEPIGAGIGLSEVIKIMKLHKGSFKIRSRPAAEVEQGEIPYVTVGELIFPYRD